MLTLTNFSQNARARTLTLKTLQSTLQRLVFVDMNLRHLFSLPSHISPANNTVFTARRRSTADGDRTDIILLSVVRVNRFFKGSNYFTVL